jgi:hypothetical protein
MMIALALRTIRTERGFAQSWTSGLASLVAFVGIGCGDDPDVVGNGGARVEESVPLCFEDGEEIFGINASNGENGHLFAVRFDPWPTDVAIQSFDYRLGAPLGPDDPWDPSLGHGARLLVSAEATPPDSPTWDALVDVPADPDASPSVGRFVGPISVDPPVIVPAGSYLYLAIEMVITPDGDRIIVGTCNNRPGIDDMRTFWSNSAEPPFPWADLSTFGADFEVAPYVRLEVVPVDQ